MNYQEALAYIYSFTDFERSGKYTRDRNENMPRTAALLALLDNPHQRYTNTLIAGTKGKGSTAAMIERVLREAGVRTGLYTQPDLHTFRERMRINGQLISEEEVARLLPAIQAAVEQVQAAQQFGSFITYEVGTALALHYFAQQKVQHAVVEVGVGGRLDATNLTHPLVSVITSISFDHINVLGNTLDKIATEKAGIIKPNGIVVTSAQSPEALLAIAAIARLRQARLVRVGSSEIDPALEHVEAGQLPPLSYHYHSQSCFEGKQLFTIQGPEHSYRDLELPLAGQHQLENATAAVAALEQLRGKGIVWSEYALREGLRIVHWPARIEIVGHNPTIIVDGAHNTDSMHKLHLALRASFNFRRLLVVLSVLNDKDLSGMIDALAEVDEVVLTSVHSPRVASTRVLSQLFAEHVPHIKVHVSTDSTQAMNLACQLASPDDLICATGSIYFAAEALRWAAAHGDRTAASEIEGIDH